jgi:hypothetical protein
MVQIKRSDMRQIDDAFAMGSGYVLNFSDRTMSEWFEDELRINIDDQRYKRRGTSKANRLRTFIEDEPASLVARTLRALWAYREGLRDFAPYAPHGVSAEDRKRQQTKLFEIIDRIESGAGTPSTDAVVAFIRDETLEELVQAIRRDAEADKPQAALDRLHTYSMKKFAHLLKLRNAPTDKEEPLHSRVGRYVKLLEAERELRPVTKQIMKNCIGIFQSYNDVRNSHSFAHDNVVVEKEEARFIFETVVSMLRFVRAVDAARFEAADSGAAQAS